MRYFFGEDTYAAREEIGRIAKEKKATIRWIDKEHMSQQGISSWLNKGTSSLFGAELLVIRDPSSFSKSHQEDIAHIVSEASDSIIFWDRVTPDKRSKLYKALKEHSQEFSYTGETQLKSWLTEQARMKESAIDSSAAQALIICIGHDRWRLLSELEKLALASKHITVELVREHVPEGGIEEEVFTMLDALVVGNERLAITAIQLLLTRGQSEFYILSMLAYQFRTLFTIQQELKFTSDPQEIARRTKLHPFVVNKNMSAAKRLSADAIIDVLTRVLAVDTAIKSGKVDARTAVVMLVAQLTKSATTVSK